MRRLIASTPLTLFVFAVLVVAGCSEPPQKEIDQAAAAVDLARTAGADKYAVDEYAAATAGLEKARAAVGDRDYRQALSYAIDARQRAQNAIGQAGEGKARAQRSIESLVTDVTAQITQLETRVHAALTARVPPKELRQSQAAVADARRALQEARTVIGAGNYEDAGQILATVRRNIDEAMRGLEDVLQRPPRKRR